MYAQQPLYVYLFACATTVVLVIVGNLYLYGVVFESDVQETRAAVCFALAAVATIVAYVTRPQPAQV
jgi:hypothetical protein